MVWDLRTTYRTARDLADVSCGSSQVKRYSERMPKQKGLKSATDALHKLLAIEAAGSNPIRTLGIGARVKARPATIVAEKGPSRIDS